MSTRLHVRPPGGPTPVLGRTIIAIQIVAALAFVAALLHAEGVRVPFSGPGGWKLEASFADASGLRSGLHSPVLVSGVPSGKVEGVRLAGGRAIVTMRLSNAVRGRLHTGAIATVEPRSALEDLTVDLAPGSPSAPALHDGARIATGHTQANVPLDRVTEVLDADTRSQLLILLDQLSTGLRSRPGALRDAVTELAPSVDAVTRVTTALSERRRRLTELVGALGRIATVAGDRSAALGETVRAARATLNVAARRGPELTQTLRALPATLDAVDGALSRTQALAKPLDPALTRLRPAVRGLPKALTTLQATVPSARSLVADLDTLVTAGRTPVHQLRSTLARLGPTAAGLRTPVAQLQPIVKSIDADKDGIGLLGERFSGVLSTNDADGAILRGLGFFEAFNPANFGVAGATGAKLAAVKADAVRALLRVCRTDNPVACLVRYLVPGLPGAVRSVGDALRPITGGLTK